MKNLEIITKKPSIKVLWLDTSSIWNINMSLWKRITKLVLEQKIVVVDTGQRAEMLERFASGAIAINAKSKSILSIYEAITGKFNSIDHSTFLARQTELAMSAYVQETGKVEFNFFDLFDDLIQGLTSIFDEQNKYLKAKWGTARVFKTLSPDIAMDWRSLRQEARSKKQTLKERRAMELLGMHGALENIFHGTNEVRKKNLVNHYLRKWKRATGNNDFQSMQDFFKSEYYQTIPYVNIHSWIISDLIVGNEEPRSSDYFDTIMISMILPYADFMLVDGPMRNRLSGTLKLVTPQGPYTAKLITLKELKTLLNSI